MQSDQFLVHKFLDPGRAEFTAGAGALYASKGQIGALGAHYIDKDHASFKLIGYAHCLLTVLRENVGAQPK
jgi:hypothetical protein